MAVEKPLVATSMEPFGGSVPETDAYSTDGGVFHINEPNALPTPCVMVSIATTKNDIPKSARNQFAGVADLPNDTLNQPY